MDTSSRWWSGWRRWRQVHRRPRLGRSFGPPPAICPRGGRSCAIWRLSRRATRLAAAVSRVPTSCWSRHGSRGAACTGHAHMSIQCWRCEPWCVTDAGRRTGRTSGDSGVDRPACRRTSGARHDSPWNMTARRHVNHHQPSIRQAYQPCRERRLSSTARPPPSTHGDSRDRSVQNDDAYPQQADRLTGSVSNATVCERIQRIGGI